MNHFYHNDESNKNDKCSSSLNIFHHHPHHQHYQQQGSFTLGENMASKEDFKEKYDIMDKINSGTYATVHKCKSKSDGQIHAVKIIKKSSLNKSNKTVIANEIMINIKLTHVNIVEGGELFDEIVQRSQFTETDAHDFIVQVFRGLAYCHEKSIIHRDIKPENILLSKKGDEITIKIADFGVSKDISKSGELHMAMAGSLGYMAPEVALQKKNTIKVDAYSAGIILYIMLCGYPPFPQSESKSTMLAATKKPNIKYDTANWSTVTGQCLDVVKKLLEVNPENRYSVQMILDHEWCTKIENLDGAKINRQESLQSLVKFNVKRKLMAMLGVFSVAGMLTDTIKSESLKDGSFDAETSQIKEEGKPIKSETMESIAGDTVLDAEIARRSNIEFFEGFISDDAIFYIGSRIIEKYDEYKAEILKMNLGKDNITAKDVKVNVQCIRSNVFLCHVTVRTSSGKPDALIYVLKDKTVVSCASLS